MIKVKAVLSVIVIALLVALIYGTLAYKVVHPSPFQHDDLRHHHNFDHQ